MRALSPVIARAADSETHGRLLRRRKCSVIYGRIAAAHQLRATLAAGGDGLIRTRTGDYRPVFWIAGTVCSLAGSVFLFVNQALTSKGHFQQAFDSRLEPLKSEA
jgi:hypothetical protein